MPTLSIPHSREIATMRLDLVRNRAMQVSIGLHARQLNALQLCGILVRAGGAVGAISSLVEDCNNYEAFWTERNQSSMSARQCGSAFN